MGAKRSHTGQPGSPTCARFETALHERNHVIQVHLLLGSGATVAVLDHAVAQSPLANDQAVGDAEQVDFRELDPRPRIAIVEQYLDAGLA
jgi:hypothetical protein